jgi:cytochrome c-type biogenesis protein CcmH
MKLLRQVTVALALVLLGPVVLAAEQAPVPGSAPRAGTLDPAMALRLKRLESELRCLVCQNQTLADSEAGLAQDLRNQVEELALQGMSDAQIKSWLQDRYGDFVLYRPPVRPTTWVLWFGPFVILLAALVFWIARLARLRRSAAPAVESTDDFEDVISAATARAPH